MNRIGMFLTQRLGYRENQIFLALTVLIGVLAGLSAVLFTLCIQLLQRFLFGTAPTHLRLFLVPPLVSLLTGYLLAKFFPEVRGSGVPQTETAYHLHQGNIPARVPLGKFLTGVLCVGSGHSMGREGPSVQIGAGIASVIGRWFRLSPSRVRDLVPIGAAAALSAAFNTPVSAVLFALEEIIGDMNAALLGSTVLASVSAVIIERSILGNDALFRVPAYHLADPAELAGYAVLGILGGIVSVIFCKALLGLRLFFLRLPRKTEIFQPAMGGVLIGIILIFVPQVMGVGYEYVGQALSGSLALRALIVLCVFKLVATVVSYSSGNAGGIFAPSLFLGAMAGGAVGTLMHRFAPFPTGDSGAYALVGMGVLFAGIIRAPMTSVFMIFELTQDYQILVPLMVANLLSFLISKHFQPKPIYHALLEQNHIYLPGPESRLPAGAWRARDLMLCDMDFIPSTSTVGQTWDLARNSSQPGFLVGSKELLHGVVTYGEIEKAIESGRGEAAVTSLMTAEDWPHVHPDHPLDVVLERLGQSTGILPVLSRHGFRKIEGVITRESVLQVFDQSGSDSKIHAEKSLP